MVYLYYFDITFITDDIFYSLLNRLPLAINKKILRFKSFNDQCLSLVGKVILEHILKKKYPFEWGDMFYTAAGKPYINYPIRFNISHSGKFVVVVFSENEIGVDLEEQISLHFDDIIKMLHISESEFIDKSNNPIAHFYYTWTRKEAFLKASGVGIIGEELGTINCLENGVLFKGKRWFIEMCDILEGYQMAICQNNPFEHLVTTELSLNDILLKNP